MKPGATEGAFQESTMSALTVNFRTAAASFSATLAGTTLVVKSGGQVVAEGTWTGHAVEGATLSLEVATALSRELTLGAAELVPYLYAA